MVLAHPGQLASESCRIPSRQPRDTGLVGYEVTELIAIDTITSLTAFLIELVQLPMVLWSVHCSRHCLLESVMIFAISPLGGTTAITTIITMPCGPPPIIMLDY
jgi:hypothetical protein